MSTNRGFFTLTSAQDLFEKAVHDLERLKMNPLDTYAAFDFFVTARHIPDWLSQPEVFSEYVELRICRHLADGAKHLIVTAAKHKQVKGTSVELHGWGNSWGDAWGDLGRRKFLRYS